MEAAIDSRKGVETVSVNPSIYTNSSISIHIRAIDVSGRCSGDKAGEDNDRLHFDERVNDFALTLGISLFTIAVKRRDTTGSSL